MHTAPHSRWSLRRTLNPFPPPLILLLLRPASPAGCPLFRRLKHVVLDDVMMMPAAVMLW